MKRKVAALLVSVFVVILAVLIGLVTSLIDAWFLAVVDGWSGAVPFDWPVAKQRLFIILALVGAALAIFLLWLVAYLRGSFLSLRAHLKRESNDEGRKVVIMGLSHPESFLAGDGELDEEHPVLQGLIDAGFQCASASVAAMLADGLLRRTPEGRLDKTSPGSLTWVQNLRAIRPHFDTLRAVVVVPSTTTSRHASAFRGFLERILSQAERGHVKIYVHGAPDYSQFESVRDAMESARKFILSKTEEIGSRIEDKDICIDATGGTAAFSIAVGIVTLNHDMVYSYVTSFENDPPRGGEAMTYDARVDFDAFIPGA